MHYKHCILKGTKNNVVFIFSFDDATHDVKIKNFEHNTSSTHFLVHFISYNGELLKSTHCYNKNGKNVNNGQ